MKNLLFLVIFSSIVFLGFGCANSNEKFIVKQQSQIDELSRKLEGLSGSLSTSSKQALPLNKETAKQQAAYTIQNRIIKKSNHNISNSNSSSLMVNPTIGNKVSVPEQKIDYGKINLKSIVQLTCWEDATNNFSNALWGTGVLVGERGLVLTNAHVISFNKDTTCAVGLMDSYRKVQKQGYFAEVVVVGVSGDFAMLKITQKYNGTDFVPIGSDDVFPVKNQSCKEEELQLGEKLIIAGYPAIGGGTITLTEGIISGFDGDYIKTSAKIAHGNSGGGAFLYNGCWIGIPTSAKVDDIESLGYIFRWDK